MADAKLSENAVRILQFLADNDGDITAHDIADALDLGVRSVVGSVNSLVRKEFCVRSEEVPAVDEDGKTKKVKFISLTELGREALDTVE